MVERRHAVVLGGSIAGVIAARVISKHFERVTILERDATLELGAPRKGVPQATQAHGLLFTGVDALEQLFPGWIREIAALGGVQVDHRAGVWVHDGNEHARVLPSSDGLMASRGLIESTLRQHMLQRCQNVTCRGDVHVDGLCWSQDARSVTGVRAHTRSDHAAMELPADLVIDCTGRRSQLPSWLEASGRTRVPEETLRIDLHYTTFTAEPAGKSRPREAFTIVSMAPPNLRAGVMLQLEGGLPSPVLAQNLDQLQLIGEATRFSYPASRRLRYERVRDFPRGLLVLGDALTSFNPMFGQGITVAALEGLCLDQCLQQSPSHLGREFLRRAQRIVEAPWSIAAHSDLRFPDIEGKRSLTLRLAQRYLARIYRAGAHDPVVALRLLEVINLARKQTALLHPAFLARVLRGGQRGSQLTAADIDLT